MTHISVYEFRQIDVPNFKGYWECEHLCSTFIYLQTVNIREDLELCQTLKLSSQYSFSSKKAA